MAAPGDARTAPRAEALRELERDENFPVALRLLPAELRADLRAVYDVVRTIDDLGDEYPGDRAGALADFVEDLATVWSTGAPRSPVLARMVPTARRRSLPPEPFQRLVAANLQDQLVHRYGTFAELLDYCALSAAPIGRIVLAVFGEHTAGRVALADRMCAGLQVVEHLQDVGEDRRRGRIYLPLHDLAAHGVREEDLDLPTAPFDLRGLVLAEVGQAAELLDAGDELLASLSGWARLAVAGYLAGGRAAVDAVRRVDGDVLARAAVVRRVDVLRHLLPALLRAVRPALLPARAPGRSSRRSWEVA